MSESVRFKATLDVTAVSEPAITKFAIEHLLSQGFVIANPHEWETPGQFCRRIGIKIGHFNKQIRHPRRPFVHLEFGPSGRRIKFLASNVLFEQFCRRNLDYQNQVNHEDRRTPA